jgi:hypothetical protein
MPQSQSVGLGMQEFSGRCRSAIDEKQTEYSYDRDQPERLLVFHEEPGQCSSAEAMLTTIVRPAMDERM